MEEPPSMVQERRHSTSELGATTIPEKQRRTSSPGPATNRRSIYIKNQDLPRHKWKINFQNQLGDEKITALCAGPQLNQVFVASKDSLVLVEDGTTIISYNASQTRSTSRPSHANSPKQSPTIQPPSLDNLILNNANDVLSPITFEQEKFEDRGRKSIDMILRLSEKDFIGTVYYVADANARRSVHSPIPQFEKGWVLAHWTLWKIVQWEIGSQRPRRVYPACTTTCIRPPFLWGVCDDGIVREWDVRTGNCLRQLHVGEIPTQICVSSKNRFLFLTKSKSVDRWNLSSNLKEAELIVDAFIDDIVMDEHGDYVYGKSPKQGIFAWDVYSKGGRINLKWPVMLGKEECINWLFVRSSRIWICGSRSNGFFLEEVDPVSREKVRGWKLGGLPMGMAIRAKAEEVYTGGMDGCVEVWDTLVKSDATGTRRVFRDIYG
jgi:hypothetical protein